MSIIMGTAGHIDHGKTTLIRALSGIDCDRLKDEKKRGITIELGFAFLDFPDTPRIGIVDVPGHEKFVKNMVSGAAGIDFVLLTVAADESIMPQTREHLEICSLLGIDKGLVALTKTDTVDQEIVDLAREELQEYLEGTFLEDSPIIPVSSHTGYGLEELRSGILEIANSLQSQEDTDIFRLPVDRVFTMRGHGTVITGTLVSGSIQVGEQVTIYPGGQKSKVRSLQVHGDSVQTAYSGQRTAVNLHGLEVDDLQRGDCIARPGTLFPSHIWDVELKCLSSSPKPLKHRKEMHFHHGSREILARLHLLDRDQLQPGETAPAQFYFPSPMVGLFQDKFVVRSFSPLMTVGGGSLLNPTGTKIKRYSSQMDKLYTLMQGDPQQVALTQLKNSGKQGLTFEQLKAMTLLSGKKLQKLLQDLNSRQYIAMFDKEEQRYISQEVVRSLLQQLQDFITRYHRNNPMKAGISRSMLASNWAPGLGPKLFNFVLEKAINQNILVSEQEVLKAPDHKISLASDQTRLKEKLLQIYTEADIQPPNLNSVLEELGVSKKDAVPVLDLLAEEGKLRKVKAELYFSVHALDKIKQWVYDHFQEKEEMAPTDFKHITGLSRKYSIPLLEYLDKEKITMRVGDSRKLRKGS
ncbi:MAG: selenocysteine-specific translation elongation factor [Thermodesulfobacteriota bacterium]